MTFTLQHLEVNNMKKIIYTNADNSVVVITPAPKARLTKQVQIGEKKALGIDGESLQILKKDNSGKLVEDENGEFLYVDLMIPVYETQFAETENKFIERIAKKDVPTGLKYKLNYQHQEVGGMLGLTT